LECAGRLTGGRNQDITWILWKWNPAGAAWSEICRAQARNRDWVPVIAPVAVSALNPQPKLVDVAQQTDKAVADILAIH
jgi:hypothetical protein